MITRRKREEISLTMMFNEKPLDKRCTILSLHLRCESKKVFSLSDLPEYDTPGKDRRLLLCRHSIALIQVECSPRADLTEKILKIFIRKFFLQHSLKVLLERKVKVVVIEI